MANSELIMLDGVAIDAWVSDDEQRANMKVGYAFGQGPVGIPCQVAEAQAIKRALEAGEEVPVKLAIRLCTKPVVKVYDGNSSAKNELGAEVMRYQLGKRAQAA